MRYHFVCYAAGITAYARGIEFYAAVETPQMFDWFRGFRGGPCGIGCTARLIASVFDPRNVLCLGDFFGNLLLRNVRFHQQAGIV